MQVGLEQLIDEELAAYVEESRRFNAASKAAAGDQPDPATPEGLQEARGRLSAARTGGRAAEHVAEVGGRRVPVWITVPQGREARGAYLIIHGGASTPGQRPRVRPAAAWRTPSGRPS